MPVVDDGTEPQAALAFVLEPVDARQAIATWERYLTATGEQGAWTAHARARVEHLRRHWGQP
jgi:hypothetical protein